MAKDKQKKEVKKPKKNLGKKTILSVKGLV